MKKETLKGIAALIIVSTISAISFTACVNRPKGQEPEPIEEPAQDAGELADAAYAEIISFIQKGFDCHWEGMNPDDKELSAVLNYESPWAGYAQKDINGDGINELLIGEGFEEDGSDYMIYDIFTFDKADNSLKHLLRGGERDWCTVNGAGIICEHGSNSAFESFTKLLKIEDAALIEVDNANEDLMNIKFEKFAGLFDEEEEDEDIQLVGGYTEQREPTEEEMELFKKVVEQDGTIIYTPLSVATQVVAGLNYRFYCRFQDLTEGVAEDKSSGHSFVYIYKPLQGDASVTKTEIVL